MKLSRTVGILLAVFALGLAGCGSEGPPRPPKVKVTAKKNEKPAPQVKQEPALPEPPAPPEQPAEPKPPVEPVKPEAVFGPPVVREKIAVGRTAGLQPAIKLTGIKSRNPHPTKEQALADALTVARTELMRQLDQLEPPIHTRPSMVTMRSNYMKGELREILPSEDEKQAIRKEGQNANVRWVEIDLELTEDHVQRLRSAERVTDGFRVAAMLFALVAALYGFLRLDQLTKGYLTIWLGLAAGAAVVVVGLFVLG